MIMSYRQERILLMTTSDTVASSVGAIYLLLTVALSRERGSGSTVRGVGGDGGRRMAVREEGGRGKERRAHAPRIFCGFGDTGYEDAVEKRAKSNGKDSGRCHIKTTFFTHLHHRNSRFLLPAGYSNNHQVEQILNIRHGGARPQRRRGSRPQGGIRHVRCGRRWYVTTTCRKMLD